MKQWWSGEHEAPGEAAFGGSCYRHDSRLVLLMKAKCAAHRTCALPVLINQLENVFFSFLSHWESFCCLGLNLEAIFNFKRISLLMR